jgi:hypothetical protein
MTTAVGDAPPCESGLEQTVSFDIYIILPTLEGRPARCDTERCSVLYGSPCGLALPLEELYWCPDTCRLISPQCTTSLVHSYLSWDCNQVYSPEMAEMFDFQSLSSFGCPLCKCELVRGSESGGCFLQCNYCRWDSKSQLPDIGLAATHDDLILTFKKSSDDLNGLDLRAAVSADADAMLARASARTFADVYIPFARQFQSAWGYIPPVSRTETGGWQVDLDLETLWMDDHAYCGSDKELAHFLALLAVAPPINHLTFLASQCGSGSIDDQVQALLIALTSEGWQPNECRHRVESGMEPEPEPEPEQVAAEPGLEADRNATTCLAVRAAERPNFSEQLQQRECAQPQQVKCLTICGDTGDATLTSLAAAICHMPWLEELQVHGVNEHAVPWLALVAAWETAGKSVARLYQA